MMTDGSELRRFTHLADISRGFHLAFEAPAKRVYEIVDRHWHRIEDIAWIIKEETGCELYSGAAPGRVDCLREPDNIVPGWSPQISLDDGIAMMIKEYKERLA